MQELSNKRLFFSSSVEISTLPDGARLLRQTERNEYLALAPDRRDVMERFDGKATVEEVLHQLLVEGKSPGIRAFYDLVMTGIERGFLVDHAARSLKEGVEKPVPPASPSQKLGVAVSLALIAAGLATLLRTEILIGHRLSDWFLTLVLTSVGLSLPHALAASALRGFGRQTGEARVRWDRLIPFFHLDTRDAFMGGRFCEIAVALRSLAAPFLMALVGRAFESDPALLASCIVALTLVSPFGDTPGHTLLHAAFRKEYELPKCAQRFLNAKLFAQIFNWKEKLHEENYLLTYCTCAILWLTGVFWFANRLIHGQVDALYIAALAELPPENEQLTWTALGILSVVLAAVIVYFVWLIARGVHRMAAPILFPAESRFNRRASAANQDDEAATIEFLRGTLLFSQVSEETLKSLAGAMKTVVTDADETVIRERDPGDCMFVVRSGSVEVCKENESGFLDILATLKAGDVFGEMALLDNAPRSSSVRTREAATLLSLSRKDFSDLLLGALGAEKIREIVQISSFLRRNAMFADWHPNALVNLAHKFSFEERLAGQKIIEKDKPNESFFIVYQGHFKVLLDDEELNTLGPGDFCGEISLLRDTPATADVVASSYARCLKLQKDDFLQFVSHDFLTGLSVESAADERAKSDGRRAA